MPRIRTIQEANQALLPYVPLVSQLTGKGTTLERIRPLMHMLGDPQNTIRVVHLAGTSGKTSTSYFMSALLTAAGQRTGLTVSPHVDSVTERAQINGKPLDDAIFCACLETFLNVIADAPAQPSYFELLYAFSLWVFAQENVDYAVVETGMGGLYDATNVVDRADKLCIITDIGFDHMHVLGNTLPEIAAQKAGIIHQGNAVICYKQAPEIMEVFERRATEQGAELHVTTEDQERQAVTNLADSLPAFQQRNWLLAYAAYRFLVARDGLPNLPTNTLLRTQAVQVPARMERYYIGDKTIIMDGAHNGQKLQTFLASFRHLYPDAKPAVLLALKEGKEPSEVVPQIAAIASRVIVTSFQTSQDLPTKAINPNELAELFKQAGTEQVLVEPDLQAAYQTLLSGPESICIITGSFYMLSQLRSQEKSMLT